VEDLRRAVLKAELLQLAELPKPHKFVGKLRM
jgi:hypothetical protein